MRTFSSLVRVQGIDRWKYQAGKNTLIIALIVAAILTVIGFVFSEIVNATTQESINQNNSTSSKDKQKIIVTWLETNDTKTSNISGKDFWVVFETLPQQSINESSSLK